MPDNSASPAQTFTGRIGFLGTGKMATALASGLIQSGFIPADRVLGSDLYAAAREAFTAATSARTVERNSDVVREADVLFLSVKPQQMAGLLQEIAPLVTAEKLIVSIAAGWPISRFTDALGQTARIIRVMPNTPCLVGAGASAYALGGTAGEADGQLAEAMLSTVGIAVAVPESLLDAVTGLSGSGPAYGYQMIEALSDGGVRVGLPRSIATKLAAQTLLGAAKMVLETGEHPGPLKDAVTSPGGTTIAGVHALEQAGVRAGIINAVVAATQRAVELGK